MNTRTFIKFDENEQELLFHELPEEDEQIFRNCIEESRHFQEITQLYEMMLFNLDQIFLHYDFHFDDRVFPLRDEAINILYLNALVGNAVSAARTLIESMEVFDREYIDSEGNFKKKFISRAYDEYFSYRFIDFIRNYLQHGHVPMSFDGERIFFQLSEILDANHIKFNASLKKQMKNIEQELFNYGNMNTRLAVVPMLYEYFLLAHMLVHEFFKFVEMHFIGHFSEVRKVLEEHREYVLERDGYAFVAVYMDEAGMVHGFCPEGDVEGDMEQWIEMAGKRLQQYESRNGHAFFLEIHYCLENRMPQMCRIDDDMLSENLAAFCLRIGTDIRYLSFETYYGNMTMNTVYRLFPYIQFEDGVHWNVSYQDVSIADFVRTFPQVQREGLKVFANNVGGADELFQRMMQDWSAYLCDAQVILANLGIHSPVDVLDWASRVAFVWQAMKWFAQSFSKLKKKKPLVRDIRNFIRCREVWDLDELAKNLHARRELLKIVLEEQGYVCKNGTIYTYDQAIAEQLEQERNKLLEKRYESHGTHVNCYEMNQAVEQLNADLMYLAIQEKEAGNIEAYEETVKELLKPLKNCEPYVGWDDLCKCVKIARELPSDFGEENLHFVWHCVNEVDENIYARTMEN